jgi:hypothetical protein
LRLAEKLGQRRAELRQILLYHPPDAGRIDDGIGADENITKAMIF